MFLYTIKSMEEIFGSTEEEEGKGSSSGEIEIRQHGRSFMVQPISEGQMKITRIISSDPQDYLNPEWQPGSILHMINGGN